MKLSSELHVGMAACTSTHIHHTQICEYTHQMMDTILKSENGTRKVTQWLEILLDLPEVPSLASSSHVRQLTTPYNSSFNKSSDIL